MDLSNIGKKIKSKRIDLSLTQKELADKLHVSSQLISKWETNESTPSLEYIDLLCKFFNIPISEFLEEQKPKKEKKKLSKKTIKTLIISCISLFSILFITGFSFLTYYVFVPACNKEKYIKQVNKSIYKTVEKGFYNLVLTGKLDGDVINTTQICGYMDENNGICYYNSKTGEIVKDNIVTTRDASTKHYYNNPNNINNISELFQNQLESLGTTGDDFSFDDLKYIRKTKNGFYFELSSNFFTSGLSNTSKKNLKLTDKIKGNILIEDGFFKSMTITIKYYHKPNNEHFTSVSETVFKDEKQEIEHYGLENKTWVLVNPSIPLEDFITETIPNSIPLDTNISERLSSEPLYESSCGDICLISGEAITYINPENLSIKNTITLNKNKYEADGKIYENGYIYSVEDIYVHIFNTDLSLYKTIKLYTAKTIDNVYLYEGKIYYSYIWSHDFYLYSIDIESESISRIKNYMISQTANFSRVVDIKYSGKYAYWHTIAYHDGKNYVYVVDLLTKEELYKIHNTTISYIDLQGNLYYNKSNTVYFNETDKIIKGSEFICEIDGFVYTKDSEGNIYKYKNGDLFETIIKQNENQEINEVRQIGDYYCNLGEDILHHSLTNDNLYFEDIYLNNYYFYPSKDESSDFKILEIVEDKIIVGLGSGSYISGFKFTYISYYTLSDLSKPVKIAELKDFKIIENKNSLIYCFLEKDNMEYKYYVVHNNQ